MKVTLSEARKIRSKIPSTPRLKPVQVSIDFYNLRPRKLEEELENIEAENKEKCAEFLKLQELRKRLSKEIRIANSAKIDEILDQKAYLNAKIIMLGELELDCLNKESPYGRKTFYSIDSVMSFQEMSKNDPSCLEGKASLVREDCTKELENIKEEIRESKKELKVLENQLGSENLGRKIEISDEEKETLEKFDIYI